MAPDPQLSQTAIHKYEDDDEYTVIPSPLETPDGVTIEEITVTLDNGRIVKFAELHDRVSAKIAPDGLVFNSATTNTIVSDEVVSDSVGESDSDGVENA